MQQTKVLTRSLLAAWIGTFGCVVLLWNLARLYTPRPEEFAALLGVCLLGSLGIFINGLLSIRQPRKAVPLANIAIALGVWCALGVFVQQILTNEEGEIPISGHAGKPAPVKKFRLLDLNVLHGFPDFDDHEKRFAATVAEFKQHDADVLVLQEVWNTNEHGNMAERLSQALGFNYVYARANGSRPLIGFEEGAAILSRFPILEARRLLLKPRSPWWENRIALVAVLDLGNDRLTLAGVHLAVSSPDDQASYLVEKMRSMSPNIIAGDLNAVSNSMAVRAFEKEFVEAIPEGAATGPVIDHVFLLRGIQERWHTRKTVWIPVVQLGISDHDGILVDLERR